MDDQTSPLIELRHLVANFVNERRWKHFHSPKNLATSLMIEGAELCEHFQWLTAEETMQLVGTVDVDSPIAEEMADILSYLLALANVLEIDLAHALQLKMLKNAIKYPVPKDNHSQ